MNELVYLNGEYVPLAEARIAVTDYGFLFGYGLYETMRSYNGKIFHLKDHLERLEKAAKILDIPREGSDLEKAVVETLRRSGIKEARVRLTMTPGEGSLTPDQRTCHRTTVLVTVITYTPFSVEFYQKGYRALTSAAHRNSQSQLLAMKTSCFLENMLARQQAREDGADEAILLNEKGQVAEASSSNLFLVSRGVLKTPGLESGILPGITRKIVLELADSLDIRSEEATVFPDELHSAGEAFLTNSLIEIMPLTAIDNKMVGQGTPGVVTQQLMSAYRQLVNEETS